MIPFRFPYTRISRPTDNLLLRYKNQPLLDMGLLNPRTDQLTKVEAFIDTGSQWCLFNKEYAEKIGIQNYRSKEYFQISGVGGPQANTAFFHDLDLIVYTNFRKLTIKEAIPIPTKIGFLEKDFGFGAILGVYGFLDHFSFLANIPQHYFELTPQFGAP